MKLEIEDGTKVRFWDGKYYLGSIYTYLNDKNKQSIRLSETLIENVKSNKIILDIGINDEKTTKQNIKVTVDAVVLLNDNVVLIRRKNEPFKGRWALPGGFVNDDEKFEVAVSRELKEETGIDLLPTHFDTIGVFSDIGRDPRGRTVTVAYLYYQKYNSRVKELLNQIKAGDDANEVIVVPIDYALSKIQLAFDHDQILHMAQLKYEERVARI